jgi:hypothetical protein
MDLNELARKGWIGRVGGILALLGLTILPLVSCAAPFGHLTVYGHNVLRNRLPSSFDLFGGQGPSQIFESPHQWLVAVFWAAVIAATIAIFYRGASAGWYILGIGGIVLLIVFYRASYEMVNKMEEGMSEALQMEVGTYAAFFGFGLMALQGFLLSLSPAPSVSPGTAPPTTNSRGEGESP